MVRFAAIEVTQPLWPALRKRTCVHLSFSAGMGGMRATGGMNREPKFKTFGHSAYPRHFTGLDCP